MECQLDKDCPSTLVCYNTTWTNHQAGCYCSTWFGFSGIDCDQILVNPTSTYRVATSSFIIVAWACVLSLGVKVFMQLLKRYQTSWTVSHTCQAQLFLASLLCLVSEILNLASAVRPADHTILIPIDYLVKGTPLFFPSQTMNIFGYCFVFLSIATFPIHWREVANRAFRPHKEKLSYIKPLVVYEIVFLGSVMTLCILGRFTYALLISLPLFLALIISYGIGGYALWRVLTKAATITNDSGGTGKFLKSARSVAKTSFKLFLVGSILLIINITFFIYSSTYQWQDFPPGVVNPIVALTQVNSAAFACAAAFGQYYLFETVQAMSSNSKAVSQNSKETGSEKKQESTKQFSAQPDSIVLLEDLQQVKKKKKAMKKQQNRLRPVTDYSENNTLQNEEEQGSSI